MDNNSADKMQFGFGKAKDEANKEVEDSTISPVEGESPIEETANVPNDYEGEYTDNRTVTINLVKNYSLYRKVNDKVLPKRKDYIGGSINSSMILSSNKGEVEAYFPNLIGISYNNPDFVNRVKAYLNNIRIPVDELGKTFDVSFHYYHKKDYYHFKNEEERIEKAYQNADRSSIKKIREALNEKIKALNVLEGTKYKYGYPVNITDYLMYRHCLLYHDVAKDIALINSDPNIRFYFKDDVKEAQKRRKYRESVNKAKANYVACLADDTLFDAVYIQYCVINNLPVISSLAEDKLEREVKLDKFSTEEPIKFNKIFNNKDNKLIANIEILIARGELVRSQYNQNITSSDGEFIGANMSEAISWFKNPNNTSAVNAYLAKLRNV